MTEGPEGWEELRKVSVWQTAAALQQEMETKMIKERCSSQRARRVKPTETGTRSRCRQCTQCVCQVPLLPNKGREELTLCANAIEGFLENAFPSYDWWRHSRPWETQPKPPLCAFLPQRCRLCSAQSNYSTRVSPPQTVAGPRRTLVALYFLNPYRRIRPPRNLWSPLADVTGRRKRESRGACNG